MIEVAAQNVNTTDLLLVGDDYQEVVAVQYIGDFVVLFTKDVCRVHPHERWYKTMQTVIIE